jgi:hypothetical protein
MAGASFSPAFAPAIFPRLLLDASKQKGRLGELTALRASCFNYLVARAWRIGGNPRPHNGRENDSVWPEGISQAITFHSIEISSCKLRRMALRRTRTENLALTMLARDGIAAIWTLHLAASDAYRDGHKAVAVPIIEIADAAECEWLRRTNPLPL